MKIVYLITKSNWGGAQKYVYELATHIPRTQFEPRVIVGGTGPLIERLESESIKVIPIDNLGRDVDTRKDFDAFKELWNILRREQPDILHINSSKAGIMGALIGRMIGIKKIIFTAHGWAFNEDRPIQQKIVIKILHWITVLLCHQTIAVSHNIASSFHGWPGTKGKITVIHNGIKPGTGYAKNGARVALSNMFPDLKKALENKHSFLIGTIAELHPIKNITGALEALNELVIESKNNPQKPYYVYLIIGEGSERAQLESLIEKNELKEHVFLVGHIPDAYQYMKAFDVFLLPSKSEALAYVLLEAGYQETPVVSTAVGGIPEVIEDMKSGILIQPRKSTEIAHALSFYAEHPEIARQHARNLNESVKNKFTLEKMVQKTISLYEAKVDQTDQKNSVDKAHVNEQTVSSN